MSGKGSARRPGVIPDGAWEAVFGRKSEPKPPVSKPNDWPQRTRKTWPSRVDLIKPKEGGGMT